MRNAKTSHRHAIGEEVDEVHERELRICLRPNQVQRGAHPHTAIVRRGKAHLPAEFGRKIVLDEVDGGLITRYAVLTGNPPDAPGVADQPRSAPGNIWSSAGRAHGRSRLLHARQ